MRLGLLAGLACGLLVACAGGDDGPATTPAASATIVPGPTRTEPAPAFDPGVTIEQAVQACREKNGARLRSFVATPVSDGDIEALFARGVDVRLLSRTLVDAGAAVAEVDVTLSVEREDETETVARSWRLERDDGGVWRFAELPDCY